MCTRGPNQGSLTYRGSGHPWSGQVAQWATYRQSQISPQAAESGVGLVGFYGGCHQTWLHHRHHLSSSAATPHRSDGSHDSCLVKDAYENLASVGITITHFSSLQDDVSWSSPARIFFLANYHIYYQQRMECSNLIKFSPYLISFRISTEMVLWWPHQGCDWNT